MDNIKYAIEGILFAAGEPVKAAKLAVVLDTSIDEVNKAVDELKKEYSENHRGFNLSLIHIWSEQASRCGVYDNARPYCCRNISGRICDYGRRDMS